MTSARPASSRVLAAELGAPALLANFSRLLIDSNRGPDDPTLVMRLSDGAIIPGNARVDAEEIARRKADWWEPYQAAISARIDAMIAGGAPPALVSIHSFTPAWKGVPRPWQVGVLWDRDPRLARPLLDALAREGDLVVGDNEPYDGALAGDTMHRHGTRRGLAHALIEVRQDLIAGGGGADRLGQEARRFAAADPRGPRPARDPALRLAGPDNRGIAGTGGRLPIPRLDAARARRQGSALPAEPPNLKSGKRPA